MFSVLRITLKFHVTFYEHFNIDLFDIYIRENVVQKQKYT